MILILTSRLLASWGHTELFLSLVLIVIFLSIILALASKVSEQTKADCKATKAGEVDGKILTPSLTNM